MKQYISVFCLSIIFVNSIYSQKVLPNSISLPDTISIRMGSKLFKGFQKTDTFKSIESLFFVPMKNIFRSYMVDNNLRIGSRETSNLYLEIVLEDRLEYGKLGGWNDKPYLMLYIKNIHLTEPMWLHGFSIPMKEPLSKDDLSDALSFLSTSLEYQFIDIVNMYKPKKRLGNMLYCSIDSIFVGKNASKTLSESLTKIANNHIIHSLNHTFKDKKIAYYQNFINMVNKKADYVLNGKVEVGEHTIILELLWISIEGEAPTYMQKFESLQYEFKKDNIMRGDYSEVMFKIGDLTNLFSYLE